MRPSLEAGRDYPRTYREFVEWFPDEESCIAYLGKLRWPNGFTCPACSTVSEPWHQTRGRLVCPRCRYQTSATRGTIFDKTRTPFTTWFETAWHMTTAKNGLSAKTLQRTLGTSYRTAWKMPHQYRIASLLKRWILGTHQGSVSDEHLQSYLEEFIFRFNRRTSRSRGLVFYRLLEQAVNTSPMIESEIARGFDWQHHTILIRRANTFTLRKQWMDA